MNGKGSTPRNLGPKFRANYDGIFRRKKNPTPAKHFLARAANSRRTKRVEGSVGINNAEL